MNIKLAGDISDTNEQMKGDIGFMRTQVTDN